MLSSPTSTNLINEAEIFSFEPKQYESFDPALARKLAGLIQQAYKAVQSESTSAILGD